VALICDDVPSVDTTVNPLLLESNLLDSFEEDLFYVFHHTHDRVLPIDEQLVYDLNVE
jgi:hypothetical protein